MLLDGLSMFEVMLMSVAFALFAIAVMFSQVMLSSVSYSSAEYVFLFSYSTSAWLTVDASTYFISPAEMSGAAFVLVALHLILYSPALFSVIVNTKPLVSPFEMFPALYDSLPVVRLDVAFGMLMKLVQAMPVQY